MSVFDVAVTRAVAAPPERVWAVLTDLDGARDFLPGLVSIERLSGPEYGVGTRWRETRKMFGKEASEEMEVVEVEPNRSTQMHAFNSGMFYKSGFRLTPTAGGTDLEMYLVGDFHNATAFQKLLGKIMGRMGAKATEKSIVDELAAIAREAESR